MFQIFFSKLGERNGFKRIWLEGKRLAAAGATPGSKYRIETNTESRSLRLVIDDDGTHVISKRTRHQESIPVIDINNQQITDLLGCETTRIKAIINHGRIEIEIHPDELAKQRRLKRLQDEIMKGTISTGSISTGLGVLDHALHKGLSMMGLKADFKFGNEIEPSYLEASLKTNDIWNEGSLAISGSMSDIQKEDIPEVSLFAAGIPC